MEDEDDDGDDDSEEYGPPSLYRSDCDLDRAMLLSHGSAHPVVVLFNIGSTLDAIEMSERFSEVFHTMPPGIWIWEGIVRTAEGRLYGEDMEAEERLIPVGHARPMTDAEWARWVKDDTEPPWNILDWIANCPYCDEPLKHAGGFNRTVELDGVEHRMPQDFPMLTCPFCAYVGVDTDTEERAREALQLPGVSGVWKDSQKAGPQLQQLQEYLGQDRS
jgi:hypothetical protein